MLMMEETASINTLFHNTNAYNALQILKDNQFRLPLAETNSSETRGRKVPALYYLSTARTLNSGYISDRSSGLSKINYPITFVLDTKKIRQKNRGVKIVSFDYWGSDKHGRNMGSAREAEERIYSNNRRLTIKGCYSVLLVVSTGKYGNNWYMRQVLLHCLKNRIPVKVFTDENIAGFKLMREKLDDRAKAVEILKTVKRDHGYQTAHKGVLPYASKTAQKHYDKGTDPDKRRYSEFDIVKMMVEKNDYRNLPYSVKSRYFNRWGNETLHKAMENYLHNLRATSARGSDELDKLDKLIKKMKAKTIEEFFDKLEKKWDKLREENNKREQEEWEADRKAKGLPTEPTRSWD